MKFTTVVLLLCSFLIFKFQDILKFLFDFRDFRGTVGVFRFLLVLYLLTI